ncbi:uncharacterized protein LOC128256265 [Drosophila gunungcola]|uniref:uncharacterized protein LOC128256265 n=1 Tax=Drosophila gunungcola TaxID=103775 RepID=UPI0022E6C293|nr:uncharacterized protein LOC128256265 [Drosophila gunungcola]
MRPTNSQFYSALTKFTALNGLNTYYFNSKRNKFCGTWKLKMYCLIHHVLCVLALGHMFYDSAGSMRLNVTILTLGGTTVFCMQSCWEKSQRLRKLANGLIQMEQKYFTGKPSGSTLKNRFYMKMLFVVVTLIRIHIFYPIYLNRLLPEHLYLNVGSCWLLYNMMLAAVIGFYCSLWQICRIHKLINDQMTLILTKSRQRNRLRKMAHCLKLYSKVLELCDQFNYEYGHVSVCVLACKSWFQITYGYEIFQIVAAPKSLDLSLSMRVFVVFSYILDALNLFFGTDIAELFATLRADSRRILRETYRMDRLLSMFTLKLAMHPKRVFLLNLFSFDRKLTLALIAKSTLYTICWLQGDYKKLKP